MEKYNLKEVRLNWQVKNMSQIRELEKIGFVVLIRNLASLTIDVYVKGCIV